MRRMAVVLMGVLVGIAAGGFAVLATDIVVAIGGDVQGWDPSTAIESEATEIGWNCYDRLLQYATIPEEDSPTGIAMADLDRLEGQLAESWEVSEDGTVVTMYLRQGVVFKSGNTFTAEDVRWSFERKWNISGGKAWVLAKFGLGGPESDFWITVLDDYTVQFKLSGPNSMLLPGLANLPSMSIVDSGLLKQHVTAEDVYAQAFLNTDVAPTGPYYVESYTTGSEIVLAAYEGYWGGKPANDRVVYKVVPAEANRVLLLKNGDVDFAYRLSPEIVSSQLDGAPGVKVISIATPATVYFGLNDTRTPLDNVLVRRAILYAVPYDDIIENVLYGHATFPTSPLAPGLQYRKEISPYHYDPVLARDLLVQAGYPEGFEMTLSYRLDIAEYESIALYLRDALAEIGINLVLDKIGAAEYAQIRGTRDYDSSLVYWIPYVATPVYDVGYNWADPQGCCNTAQYENLEVEAVFEQAKVETDPVKLEGMINAIQQLVVDDAPLVWLYNPNWLVNMRENITGYVFTTNLQTRFNTLGKS
jgi:peptide/nickel transport system substrate-binding protein